MTRDDAFYQAMLARDPRFDGKFFVGVKTTGIYCRPICPAKPKRQNVEFFPNRVAAEAAGYRPCLRCRPESAPRSPVWIGKSAIVRRAIKAIHSLTAVDFDEEQFADRFGVTARHLRRVFVEEIGKTPQQLLLENRLNLARNLLTETGLTVTEIAFGAGFNSIRRFNAAFRHRFRKSPSQMRRKPLQMGVPLQLRLPYRPPLDFNGLLHFYRTHQIGDLEHFTEHQMFRTIVKGDQVGEVSIADDAAQSCLLVEIDFPDMAVIHTIIAQVRSLFDLDSDPLVIANALEADPGIKKILKNHPGIRLPSGWDPFEVAIAAILGQLVSVERARTLVADLMQLTGREIGNPALHRRAYPRPTIHLFPTPAELAAADLTSLKSTGARKATLREFSRQVAAGELSLEPTQHVDEFMKKVIRIKGIGAWTANAMAMKVMRHTDAFPGTDLILARAMELHPREVIERMSPWRGYLAALLWREYAQTLKKPGSKGGKKAANPPPK